MTSVALEEVKNSPQGYQHWCEIEVAISPQATSARAAGSPAKGTGAAGSGAGQSPVAGRGSSTSPRPTPKKAAARAVAAGQPAGNAENEKKARALLANYQLAMNVMSRVLVSAKDDPQLWLWAEADRATFAVEEAAIQGSWGAARMLAFVQDLRAAVFSPQAVKAFKKKHSSDYSQLLNVFVVETEQRVENLTAVVKQIEDTAKVRGIAGFMDPALQKGTKRARPDTVKPTSASQASVDAVPDGESRRGRKPVA